jgi:trimeric autotransporter adhesin
MPKQIISTGVSPNDGLGDTLLDGAVKINSNFTAIYDSIGDGSEIKVGIGKTVISTTLSGNVGVGTTDPTSKLTVKGGNTSLETLNVSGISTFSSNVGIGTTIPSASLYVVGNQFVTGIITASSIVGSSGTIANITGTAATITNLTGTAATITSVTGTAATITNLTGTAATITNLTGTAATITSVTGTAGTITTFNSTSLTGTAGTITTFNSTSLTGTAGTIVTLNSTDGTITNITGTAGTITTFNSTNGTVTSLSGTNSNYTGISSVGSLSISSTQVISSGRQLQNIASLDATTTATIESAIQSAPNNFNDLQITGVSTFTNGPVFVGSGTSTGTASQPLQVTGGAYVSGNLGVGITNPTATLDVNGARIFHRSSGINTVEFGYAAGSGDANIYGLYVPPGRSFSVYSNGVFAYEVEGNNVLIGSGTSTGTASQPLQVTGGASISGNLGVGATNPTSLLHLGPGTVSRSQLEFSSGSLLTSPSAGVLEYDGTTIFATPNTSYGRASIPTTIFTSGAGTNLTTTGELTAQILFPTANDTITLPIGTYHLKFGITLTRAATSTTSASLNVTLNGFGSGSAGTFSGMAVGGVGSASAVASAITISGSSIASSIPITIASNVASGVYTAMFSGILRITTAGTFQPKYNLSANLTSATGNNTPSAANYMMLQSLSSLGTSASTGAWA